jgi:succinyl-diaminopimelate desuccinylase
MQESLENTLASLVAIPSSPDDSVACHAILHFVHEELKTHNLFIQSHTNTQNPWLIATTRNTLTPDILFYAHLDVVRGAPHMFQMKKDSNGRLLGRGVFDMKFAAACYLEFLRNYTGALSDLNIGFLFTTDEEKNSGCMSEVIATGLRPKAVFMPDGGGDWAIEKRAKGFYAVELIATGKSAHGSRPWEGMSALHSLLDAIEPLRQKYAYRDRHYPTLMINGIQSGLAINQLPDRAVAQLDFRCFNKEEMDEYTGLLRDIVANQSNLSINVHKSGDTITFDDSLPAVKEFLHVFTQVRGKTPEFCDSYGASDAQFFVPFNIPCIIVQPRGGGRHDDDEWLLADDLETFCTLIEHWIVHNTHSNTESVEHSQSVSLA